MDAVTNLHEGRRLGGLAGRLPRTRQEYRELLLYYIHIQIKFGCEERWPNFFPALTSFKRARTRRDLTRDEEGTALRGRQSVRLPTHSQVPAWHPLPSINLSTRPGLPINIVVQIQSTLFVLWLFLKSPNHTLHGLKRGLFKEFSP